ncbi:hypothetical protein QYF61_017585 [Mycteria americana]|uniref:Uncharacterized protein n=1 Tax=Mycteria americana TaxID=33587 RepID=A0AAN7MX39_MYCAM|nr:hypothetical protein QYF61_017585 [Mycteria americana]
MPTVLAGRSQARGSSDQRRGSSDQRQGPEGLREPMPMASNTNLTHAPCGRQRWEPDLASRTDWASEGEEELINETETTRSLCLSELQDMRKDFSSHPGKPVVTWLLRCCDNGASSLELAGKEAKQPGSLSREGGINKAIGKEAQALSLWRQLLPGVKER